MKLKYFPYTSEFSVRFGSKLNNFGLMLNCFGPVWSGENIIGSVRGWGHKVYCFSVRSGSGQKIMGQYGVGVPKTLPRRTLMHTIYQGCKFSGNCLNSGLHEAQIHAFLFISSPFWRLLAQIHALFQAFSLRSAYIPAFIQKSYYMYLIFTLIAILCEYLCIPFIKNSKHTIISKIFLHVPFDFCIHYCLMQISMHLSERSHTFLNCYFSLSN